jgi:hypothetical protein
LPSTTLRVEAPLDRLRYLRELQKRAAQIKAGVAKYYDDPVGFANDCINWGDGDGLTFYQEEILGGLPQRNRVAVRGPHGLRTWQKLASGHRRPVVRPDAGCGRG